MAGPFIDISVVGSKELERKLVALEGKIQRKVVSNALVKSRTRNKRHIANAIKGNVFKHPTGDMARIWKSTKLKSIKRKGVMVRGIMLPEAGRDAIKLQAVEYGHTTPQGGFVKGVSFIRATVNAHAEEELRQIGRDIETNIEKQIRKVR